MTARRFWKRAFFLPSACFVKTLAFSGEEPEQITGVFPPQHVSDTTPPLTPTPTQPPPPPIPNHFLPLPLISPSSMLSAIDPPLVTASLTRARLSWESRSVVLLLLLSLGRSTEGRPMWNGDTLLMPGFPLSIPVLSDSVSILFSLVLSSGEVSVLSGTSLPSSAVCGRG